VKGLTIQERRVLIAILIALVLGAAVKYWRRQNSELRSQESEVRISDSGCHLVANGEASVFKFNLSHGKSF